MLAPTVQTSAVGLNYHIVVPCVNGTLFYFLVHCLCLYFHVNILFSSSKYSRSHPGLACWKSAPQQAIRWFLKAQISSAALCPLFSTVVVIQNVFFFHHTFLWFPNLTLMLICCMCTIKRLWTTGTIEQDDLLLKTQVNDLIKED